MKGEREKPLGLDMPFAEAFARFLQTDPEEVEALGKKKGRPKPPQGVDAEPPDEAEPRPLD